MEHPSTEFDHRSKNTVASSDGGENICEIDALFGELKSQREE